MNDWVVISIFGLITLVLLSLVIRLYFMVNNINTSFAKLGYVIREDAKKYFDEASTKLLETNEQFHEIYANIVKDGTTSALAEAGATMEKNIERSQQAAGAIILKAREDSQQIIKSAKTETEIQAQKMLSQSATTISWVLEQYVKETLPVDKHVEIINKFLNEYINEHRS